jgi:deoxyribodipyrimidine photolyase
MADPSIIESSIPLIEKVGYAIAAILGLLYVLRWLSKAHLLALNSRISTLEKVVTQKDAAIQERDRQINEAHAAMLKQAEQHAHVMHEQCMAIQQEMSSSRRAAHQNHAVMTRLIDAITTRPCQKENYEPHHHPAPHPTEKDLPVPADKQTTAIIGGRA